MLCAVVADTREHARRAAAAVKVCYEDLPDPIFTVEVSEEGHWGSNPDAGGDLCCLRQEAAARSSFFEPRRMIERGKVDEAFTSVHHLYEGKTGLAARGELGKLPLRSSLQLASVPD